MPTGHEQFRLLKAQLERSQWFTFLWLIISLLIAGGIIGYVIAMEGL